LDDQLNPWVIEVNLSPACSERVPWLTKMLDDMALGLVDWLERRILMNLQIGNEEFNADLIKKRQSYHAMRE